MQSGLQSFFVHSLIKASYIPERNHRELQELVRYRRSIIEERARQINRIQKVLEGVNIKLGSVVSDVLGVSARDMLDAITDGEEDPEKLAYSRLFNFLPYCVKAPARVQ
jgi:transposase